MPRKLRHMEAQETAALPQKNEQVKTFLRAGMVSDPVAARAYVARDGAANAA